MNSQPYEPRLHQLVIYRSILCDDLLQQLQEIISGNASEYLRYDVTARLIAKAEELGLAGDIWKKYIVYLLAWDENVFSRTVEKNGGIIGESLRQAAIHDLTIWQELLTRDDVLAGEELALIHDFAPTRAGTPASDGRIFDSLLSALCQLPPEQMVDTLVQHYHANGSGQIAAFPAFRWDEENGLEGIRHPESVSLQDIVGYEAQKEILVKNTEAFLNGKPANHVLLVGARGTGKSSSVKGLVNQYFDQGLRLVEVPKYQLKHLNKIINTLRGRSLKFILFLDDLSFEDSETEYKHLKSMIDGGIEARPDNVILYATSNRRHLIREDWSDRAGSQDIHAADSVHEKVSLSDRFGIILTFSTPDQDKYLKIVDALAARHRIQLPQDELHRRALRWELSHSGRSGRVAQQFIHYLRGTS